jgi:archaellin
MDATKRVSTALTVVGMLVGAGLAHAQQVQPQDLGVVQAPAAGNVSVPLDAVPLPVLHSAEVAFKIYEGGATLTAAQVDKDDSLAVYEIQGLHGGRMLEADVRADGFVLELEIEINQAQVPPAVSQSLEQLAPGFTAASDRPRIEKSVRPSEVGLPEIWYEFSGVSFDVEIRSDGRAVFIEPA